MTLQEVLKARRKVLNLSQRDLAEMAGVGIATVKEIERGKGNPSLSTILALLDVVGMEISYKLRETVE